jgi:hypothetical protein
MVECIAYIQLQDYLKHTYVRLIVVIVASLSSQTATIVGSLVRKGFMLEA